MHQAGHVTCKNTNLAHYPPKNTGNFATQKTLREKKHQNLWCVGNLKTGCDTVVKRWPVIHVCWSVDVSQIDGCVSTTIMNLFHGSHKAHKEV